MWYLESRFNNKGNVFTQIIEEGEDPEFNTDPYTEFESYDRYVDKFDTLEEALEAEREAKEA